MKDFPRLTFIASTVMVAILSISAYVAAAEQATFKKFKGPKPGEWTLTAKVSVPGQKQVTNQFTGTCVTPGEDIKQRALGQLGDASKGCVVSITQDTDSVGALTTKCQNTSASVVITRINDDEYRYQVKSTMASVDTFAKFVGKACSKEIAPRGTKPASACDSCKQTLAFLKDKCMSLSDISKQRCLNSLTTLQGECTAKCKSGK